MKEEGGRRKEEGGRKKEEGRGKRAEGGGRKVEGGRRKVEGRWKVGKWEGGKVGDEMRVSVREFTWGWEKRE